MRKFLSLTTLDVNDPLPQLGRLVRPAPKMTPEQKHRADVLAFETLDFDRYVHQRINDLHALTVARDEARKEIFIEAFEMYRKYLKGNPQDPAIKNFRDFLTNMISDWTLTLWKGRDHKIESWLKDHPVHSDITELLKMGIRPSVAFLDAGTHISRGIVSDTKSFNRGQATELLRKTSSDEIADPNGAQICTLSGLGSPSADAITAEQVIENVRNLALQIHREGYSKVVGSIGSAVTAAPSTWLPTPDTSKPRMIGLPDPNPWATTRADVNPPNRTSIERDIQVLSDYLSGWFEKPDGAKPDTDFEVSPIWARINEFVRKNPITIITPQQRMSQHSHSTSGVADGIYPVRESMSFARKVRDVQDPSGLDYYINHFQSNAGNVLFDKVSKTFQQHYGTPAKAAEAASPGTDKPFTPASLFKALTGRVINVGPGQEYEKDSDVPWGEIKAGDTVNFLSDGTKYVGKFDNTMLLRPYAQNGKLTIEFFSDHFPNFESQPKYDQSHWQAMYLKASEIGFIGDFPAFMIAYGDALGQLESKKRWKEASSAIR